MAIRHRHGRARTTAVAGALVCTMGLLLGGCSDSDSGGSPVPSADSSAPTAPATAPTTAPTESPAAEVTESSGPAAATGPELKEEHISIRVPEGWKVTKYSIAPTITSARLPGTSSAIMLSDFPASSSASLDQEAKNALRDNFDPDIERVENTTLGGVEAYQLTRAGDGLPFTEIGTVHDGGDVYVQFLLSSRLGPAERDAIVDSVLASVTWR